MTANHNDAALILLRAIDDFRDKGLPYTFDELAILLSDRLQLSMAEAKKHVLRFCGLTNSDLSTFKSEYTETRPTIAESIALMKHRASNLHRKRIAPEPFVPSTDRFERCRPARSAKKWLADAPEYVVTCYSAGEEAEYRYVVALGAPIWTAAYAHRNWQIGLDPRLTPCVWIKVDRATGGSTPCMLDAVPNRRLGLKMRWNDLPQSIQRQVIQLAESRLHHQTSAQPDAPQ